MGSGRRRASRLLAVACTIVALAASAAGAASQGADANVARAGRFAASDFPQGFQASPPPATAHADQIAMAKGVDGCGPYVTIQKRLLSTPSADSSQFGDGARTFGNEIAVLPSEKSAIAFLGLYEKPSMVGCLENYLEKQIRLSRGSKIDDVNVNVQRQDIAGLGDDSVVYEGTMSIVMSDGSTTKTSIGNATVRVGRALDTVVYSSNEPNVTDVLAPAIDASVVRLRSALTRSGG
jgi:hypothetical protein